MDISAITASSNGSPVLSTIMAGLAGAFAPPLGPVMRVLWKRLTDGPVMLKRALTLDAVIEEVLYLIGPAVVGLLITIVPASTVLLLPAVLVSVGTIGIALGIIYVTVPAFGEVQGNVAATGMILATFAAGSAVGGILYGRFEWSLAPMQQLPVLTAGVAVGPIAMAVAPGVATLGIIAALTGIFLSPAMITAYFVASRFGSNEQATEVNTWVNTSQNIGSAAGSALAGVLIETSGIGISFVAAGVAALALVVVGLLFARAITHPTAQTS